MIPPSPLHLALDEVASHLASGVEIISISTAPGVVVELEATAVDRLSCAFRELRLHASGLHDLSPAVLSQWADSVCQRVTYLLERWSVLERDVQSGALLVRSSPPARRDSRLSFFEAVFRGDATLVLRRYTAPLEGPRTREQVDLHMTREVLQMLIQDLTESLPHA